MTRRGPDIVLRGSFERRPSCFLQGVRTFDQFRVCVEAEDEAHRFIDSSEIEGSYERIGYIHDEVESHDSDITTHNADILYLNTVNTNTIRDRIAVAEFNLQTALTSHDTDIQMIIAADTAFVLQTGIERALKRRMRISSLHATSQPIYQAQYALYQADLTWSYQQYKRSWSWLYRAYREATKILGEPY